MEIFDYDNILLPPRKCRVESRAECDARVQLGQRSFRLPVVPANMKTLTSSLKDRDSCCQTAMSRRKNVFGCVDVPVVRRATFAANPFSYSKSCSTFRTAGGNDPAARTSLG